MQQTNAAMTGPNHRDDVQVHLYPGADHAFARPGGEHYDLASATLALERSLGALQRAQSA